MAAEGFEIAQALGMETDLALERVTRPLVDLGPTGQQEVLIHHLVHERVHEPEPATPTPVSHRLDQIVLHHVVARRGGRPWGRLGGGGGVGAAAVGADLAAGRHEVASGLGDAGAMID